MDNSKWIIVIFTVIGIVCSTLFLYPEGQRPPTLHIWAAVVAVWIGFAFWINAMWIRPPK